MFFYDDHVFRSRLLLGYSPGDHNLPEELPLVGQAPTGDLKVLVVDDEELVREMLARLLRRNGIACEQASSQEEAIQRLEAERFDILITDQNMPGGSGAELITFVAMKSPETATIMISGEQDPILSDLTRQLGGVAFLSKPFDEEDLMSVVRVLHEEKRRRISGDEG